MKKHISLAILLTLTLLLAACGGETPQTPPEVEAPTEAVSQPTQPPAPNDTSAPVEETSATEAPVAEENNSSSANVSFANDIMPIFQTSCVECHGVRSTKEGLDMLTYENLLAGSRHGPVLLPGNANESLLVQLIVNGEMPNRGPLLTTEQIQLISDWIDQGALNN